MFKIVTLIEIRFLIPFAALFLTTLISPCWAENRISGDIHTISFSPGQNPYVVEKDIIVPEGKIVEIPAGVVFLFNSFTGCIVHGQIKVLGDHEKPVVFTSVFDSEYNQASSQLPNPFDWNGILVTTSSSGSYFNNFSLRYSVYGIKSQSQNVIIQNGLFRQNGQFHFTVFDQIQFVQDNIPYSFGTDSAVQSTSRGKDRKENIHKNEPGQQGGKTGKQTKIIRFTCLGIGIAAMGVGTAFAVRAAQRNRDYNDWDIEEHPNEDDTYNDLERTLNQSIAGAAVSYGIALLGFVGFGITFAF